MPGSAGLHDRSLVVAQAIARGGGSRRRYQTLRSKWKHRKCVSAEIISTESAYIQQLEQLIQMVDELEMNVSPVLDTITSVLDVNKVLLKQLKEHADDLPMHINSLFEQHIPALRAPYERYYGEFEHGKRQLLDARARSSPTWSVSRVLSLFITPIQRIPRYVLLLRELVKATDPERTEYAPLLRTQAALQRLTAHLDQQVGEASRRRALEKTESLFLTPVLIPPGESYAPNDPVLGAPASLEPLTRHPLRKLVHQGPLCLMLDAHSPLLTAARAQVTPPTSDRNGRGTAKQHKLIGHAFLFTDGLLLACPAAPLAGAKPSLREAPLEAEAPLAFLAWLALKGLAFRPDDACPSAFTLTCTERRRDNVAVPSPAAGTPGQRAFPERIAVRLRFSGAADVVKTVMCQTYEPARAVLRTALAAYRRIAPPGAEDGDALVTGSGAPVDLDRPLLSCRYVRRCLEAQDLIVLRLVRRAGSPPGTVGTPDKGEGEEAEWFSVNKLLEVRAQAPTEGAAAEWGRVLGACHAKRTERERKHLLFVRRVSLVQAQFRRLVDRRLFQQARAASVVLQAHIKGTLQRRRFVACRSAAVRLQASWKGMVQRRRFVMLRSAATAVQASWRRFAAQRCFRAVKQAAVVVQARRRGLRARREFLRLTAAVALACAMFRARASRRVFLRMRRAAALIQASVRMWRARRDFLSLRRRVVVVQSLARRRAAAQSYIRPFVLELQSELHAIAAAWEERCTPLAHRAAFLQQHRIPALLRAAAHGEPVQPGAVVALRRAVAVERAAVPQLSLGAAKKALAREVQQLRSALRRTEKREGRTGPAVQRFFAKWGITSKTRRKDQLMARLFSMPEARSHSGFADWTLLEHSVELMSYHQTNNPLFGIPKTAVTM
eukprot:gnl/Trimastix_PCT/2128.p1 GENE.gnl/Trimastix_PCT/2128~~gnl/Trimastix_PCT/2128.p1  ORF type:complete len:892 (-),score=205.89 gnl/Trimastix_PCT/2128:56-2731(-)